MHAKVELFILIIWVSYHDFSELRFDEKSSAKFRSIIEILAIFLHSTLIFMYVQLTNINKGPKTIPFLIPRGEGIR